MRTAILTIALCLSLSLSAQNLNRVIIDTTLHEEVLVDTCNRTGLTGPVFGAYYETEYATYQPDKTITDAIGNRLNDYRITVVMGSWCSDSQEQVPRFYKILDELKYPENQLIIICTDRKKKTILSDIQPFNIKLVPTFIFYKDNAESGRITETPAETLEKDILSILQTAIKNK